GARTCRFRPSPDPCLGGTGLANADGLGAFGQFARDRGSGSYETVVGMPAILPATIRCLIFATAATSAFGTFGLIFPSPTPFWASPKTALRPPRNLPSRTSFTVRKTAWSTRFVALVRTCGPRYDWSASTPIPHTCFSLAASSVPRPHPPATWNSIVEPAPIWFSAASLHLSSATQSCEYVFSALTPGSAFFAPA